MAITSILPVQNSVVAPGDSFAFTIDDTYTALVIKVAQSAGDEYAYDYALGGVQAGYTVVITDNGSTHTLEVTRDSGWNKEPTTISVTENETGSSVTTSFSYYLTATAVYPEGMQPYSDQYDGTLVVTEENVTVRNDVGWIDYDTAGFVVTDMGSGKVRIELDPSISGSDTEAIHDNVAGEINAIAAKGAPTGTDVLLIEDAADSFNKKKVLITNLPGGGGGGGSGQAVYLGTYDMWEENTKGNPTANGQLIYDVTDYRNMDLTLTDANGTNFGTLLLAYGGHTVVLVDPSGDKAYWTMQDDQDHYFWDYQDAATPYVVLHCAQLYAEAGFSYVTDGSVEYEVWAMGAGSKTLGGRPLPVSAYAGDSSVDYSDPVKGYPYHGQVPVFDDLNNHWRFEHAVAQNTFDPNPIYTAEFGHFEGQLWINTIAMNLWVCTDDFTGEWTQIVQNQATYTIGGYTYDDTAGTPNAAGEAEPNNADWASVTSINFYVEDDLTDNVSAELLSLQAGTEISGYAGESWHDAWVVTGAPVDNTTYITIPLVPTLWAPGFPYTIDSHRLQTGAGNVSTDGETGQNAVLLRDLPTEVNSSGSALSELWTMAALGAGDQTLKWTDDAGTRFALVPYIAAGAPGVGNDVDDGHEIGQIWVNITLNDAYICCDNASGAASWKIIAT
jgi:hypothetical protein